MRKSNLSLKSSYSKLQSKMWAISNQSYEINKQNQILKGRFNTHKLLCRKSKFKSTEGVEPAQNSCPNTKFQRQYKANIDLKNELLKLQEQTKGIEKCLQNTQKLKNKNSKMQNLLKKLSKKIRRIEQLQSKTFIKDPLKKQEETLNYLSNIEKAQMQECELVELINSTKQQLEEEKKQNKALSNQMLQLISKKSELRKQALSRKMPGRTK